MGIVMHEEDVEMRLFREMREKRREAGLLDTYVEFPPWPTSSKTRPKKNGIK